MESRPRARARRPAPISALLLAWLCSCGSVMAQDSDVPTPAPPPAEVPAATPAPAQQVDGPAPTPTVDSSAPTPKGAAGAPAGAAAAADERFVGPFAPADAARSATGEGPTDHKVVANLNGQAITSGDIAFYARELTGQPGPYDAALERHIRRTLAEHLLLAGEAERLGLKLTEYQINEFYGDLFGHEATFDEHADITVKRQKDLVKKLIEQKIYEYHRVGAWDVFGHIIPPDPILQRQTSVTPEMMRKYFSDHRQEYDRPATVVYTVWPCRPEDAEAVRATLLDGGTPEQTRPVREEVAEANLAKVFVDAQPLLEFLRAANSGDVSETWVSDTPRGPLPLCVRLDERRPATSGDFAKEQAGLKAEIERNLREDARRQMVESLLRDSRSVWWPGDLFDDEPEDSKAASPVPSRP